MILRTSIAILVTGLLIAQAPALFAGSIQDTKVALHVTSPPVKSATVCTTHRPSSPCSEYNTQGDLGSHQYVYLVTAQAPPDVGVIGLSCGIDYDPDIGEGVDILSWNYCSDGLEFTNAGAHGVWPAAGGGNRMVWITCQETEIPPDGVHAVFGAFYVYSYGPDTLRVTPNENIFTGPEFEILGCTEPSLPLNPSTAAGTAVFSAAAASPGFNPCLGGPSICSLSPVRLFFGTLLPGDFTDRSFAINNTSTTESLVGEVSVDCPAYEIVEGEGAYDLLPGESRTVTVRFAPTMPGFFTCSIETGSSCSPVGAQGYGEGADCAFSPERVVFGAVDIGEFKDETFLVRNVAASGPNVTGQITLDCPDFQIMSGEFFDVPPGGSHEVSVRFTPSSVGPQICYIDTQGVCYPGLGGINFSHLFGSGGVPKTEPPVVALHVTAPTSKSPGICTDSVPVSPCSDYGTRGETGMASLVYLVVAEADPVLGIQGFSCGIDYDPVPGQGVEVFDWYLCGAGTGFPNAGANGNWPAAGGGYRMIWDDCQSTVLEPNDVHALAGAFYVYAYGPDSFTATANNNLSPPAMEVLNCVYDVRGILEMSPENAGSVAFSAGGADRGFNPCRDEVFASAVEIAPASLNHASQAPWITAYVELPETHDPEDVIVESVLILGTIPPDLSFPGTGDLGDFNENGIPDLVFKFDRGAFIDALPEGQEIVEVEITGDIGSSALFVATAEVRVVHPRIMSPNGGETLMAGMVAEITWETPSEWAVDHTEIYYSTDQENTWTQITDQALGNSHIWRLPAVTHETVSIRIRVHDEDGLLGKDRSDENFSVNEVVVGVGGEARQLTGLRQNLPNPFSGSTVIPFALEEGAHITLSVFNVLGQRVRVLKDTWSPAGTYEVRWDGRDDSGNRVASGLYLYRFQTEGYQATRRMLLTR